MKEGYFMADHKQNQFQNDVDQYQMENVMKQPKKGYYRVGYETTTGNETSPNHSVKKRGK